MVFATVTSEVSAGTVVAGAAELTVAEELISACYTES